MEKMIKDERLISSIVLPNENQLCVGDKSGIDKFVLYEENGEMSYVNWVAVYKNGEISSRINTKFIVEILYQDE